MTTETCSQLTTALSIFLNAYNPPLKKPQSTVNRRLVKKRFNNIDSGVKQIDALYFFIYKNRHAGLLVNLMKVNLYLNNIKNLPLQELLY